jgi:hypothetical protein
MKHVDRQTSLLGVNAMQFVEASHDSQDACASVRSSAEIIFQNCSSEDV